MPGGRLAQAMRHFRDLLPLLHPDKIGGDGREMATANIARDRVVALFRRRGVTVS